MLFCIDHIGVVYGKGVYFARDASYSHKFAYRNSHGHRHMYLSKVLTGEFTTGTNQMIVPPPKNPKIDKNVLFDSTVDDPANPTIYVVYADSQNYPLYLVTYM